MVPPVSDNGPEPIDMTALSIVLLAFIFLASIPLSAWVLIS